MKTYFRTSDGGYNKVKPPYVTWENCLRNFTYEFLTHHTIIADNVSDDTMRKLEAHNGLHIKRTNAGSSAGGFNVTLDTIFDEYLNDNNPTHPVDRNEVIYMVENDYIHAPGASKVLMEAFNELNADYVTLYDHPDKYLPSYNFGEVSQVFNTTSCHWKMTISTTMTFAAKVNTMKEDEAILREFTKGGYPRDHEMFTALRKKGRVLVSPLPGYSTHGETAWMTPHRDWESIIKNTSPYLK